MQGFIPYTALWVDFKLATYLSPLNCITSLCYYYFVGEDWRAVSNVEWGEDIEKRKESK